MDKLLPTEGPPGALNVRPLTILSVIYRIWAGIRAAQLRGWQETWVHKSLQGGHETLDGVFESNLDIEDHTDKQKPLFLFLLDYRKFFDFFVQEIILGLAEWWGIPSGILKLLTNFYQQLTSVFKFHGHFGKPWQRTNSLAQGCSFSMMLVNLPVTAWALAILKRMPASLAGISAYVEDKVIRVGPFVHLEDILTR